MSGVGPEQSGIYAASLDSAEAPVSLELGNFTGLASHPPYVLYSRDGFPVARRFDAERLAWTGDAQPLGEQGVVGATASGTGILAYGNRATTVTQLTWVDRTGRPLGTIGPADRFATLDLSADARRVVVSRGGLSTDANLWVFDTNGPVERLTTGAFRDSDPRWSPDGRKVMFVSTRAPGRPLFELSASGGTPVQLRANQDLGLVALDDWSSDGRFLLYHMTGGARGLWVLPLDGDGTPVKVGEPRPGLSDQARFSPDGRFVAYNNDESGVSQVYVERVPSTGERWLISSGSGVQPMWRGDGRELFFLTLDGDMMVAKLRAPGEFGSPAIERLFSTTLRADLQVEEYAVTSAGDRFLLAVPVDGRPTASFTVITNWLSLLTQEQ